MRIITFCILFAHALAPAMVPAQKYDAAATSALKKVLNEFAHENSYSKIQEKFKDVRDLILAGADPNTQEGEGCSGYNILGEAVYFNFVKECRFLLDHGATIHGVNNGWTPLHVASQARAFECVTLLVDRGANVNQLSAGLTPLHEAVVGGDLRIIKYLVMKGADMHAGKASALFRAATWSGLEAFIFLLENDSQPNRGDYASALLGAAVNHNYDIKCKIIKLLLEKGVPINACCIVSGQTSLYQAAYDRNNAETIRLLLDYGANSNKAENDGNTPLMIAAQYGSVKMVQDLLNGGADSSAENRQGERARDIARKNGREDIVRLLSKDKIA